MSSYLGYLGVDLLELKKARHFYKRHENRLAGLFSADEMKFMGDGKLAYKRCAMLLAGKEAVYKAIGGVRSAVEGFEKISLSQCGGQLFYKHKNKKRLTLDFISTKNFIIASCL